MTTYATRIHTHERQIAYCKAMDFPRRLANEEACLAATRSVMRAHRKSPSAKITTREQYALNDAWIAVDEAEGEK